MNTRVGARLLSKRHANGRSAPRVQAESRVLAAPQIFATFRPLVAGQELRDHNEAACEAVGNRVRRQHPPLARWT